VVGSGNTIVNYAAANALPIQGSNGLGDGTATGTNSGCLGKTVRVYSQPCHLSDARGNDHVDEIPKGVHLDGYKMGTFGNSALVMRWSQVDNVDFAIVKN